MDTNKNNGKIFGVTRNVFFLGLVSFFNDFSAEMAQSVMPAFLTMVLGAPASFVSILEGVADALSSVLKVFSGWVSDRLRWRKMPALFGYMLAVFVRPFLALTTSFSQVFGLRVLDRIGKGVRDAPRDALIVESTPREELGRAFGVHRSLDTLGATLGPLFAFFALPFIHGSYRGIFLIAFVVGLGALFSFAFVREPKRVHLSLDDAPRVAFDWKLFAAHRRFILVVCAIFIFGLGTLPLSLVLLRVKDVGFSLTDMPLMYFVYSLTFVLTAIPLGRFGDRVGRRFVIAGGFLAAAVAYFGLASASGLFAITLFFVVLGLYSAATDGLQRALAAQFLASGIMATGQGFLNMAVGFSSFGASIIGGLLWDAYGDSAAFFYAGIVSIIGAILFFAITSRK